MDGEEGAPERIVPGEGADLREETIGIDVVHPCGKSVRIYFGAC